MNRDLFDFKIIAEETLELVLIFKREGTILYVNKSAKEKLGYDEAEFEQLGMSRIFRQEFQQGNGTFSDFDIEKISGSQETAMYRKNSTCFPVSMRLFDMGDGSYCLLAEDVRLRKNMDMKIQQLQEEEETNRKVRNEFTANVTHELRTPVNGIRGHVTTLLETVTDPEQRRTLDIIIYCCDNMSAIISNILDFSKLEAGKFSLENAEFDFYKMMDQVISTHMVEINKKELRLSLYIDEHIPQYMIGDALRISQILNNILSNAVKFTLVGQISVDVSKTMQIGDEVELFFMVKDSGIGISKEEQDKLFQSFKQADASITRRFGGTGLGLSISKQLVEMMGGSIYVESEKGKGSSFSFNIKLNMSKTAKQSDDKNDIYQKWESLITDLEQDDETGYMEYGTEVNKQEIKKRMEKLLLSMELGSWDKAEMLADAIKALAENADSDMKRKLLRMDMAIRKENYEKSMAAYELVKAAFFGETED